MALMVVLSAVACRTTLEDTQKARDRMVDLIAARGVEDDAVLKAMRSFPRHELVPERERAWAYDDRPLPIGYGQTISQPYMVAVMTEAAALAPGDKVLEVGTGSGYQAAILAGVGAEVFSVEIVGELADRVARDFERLGVENVNLRRGDGYAGWPEHAPFAAIVVTAAPETVPPPLLGQLAEGGRLVIPVGPSFMTQQLLLVTKQADGRIKVRQIIPVILQQRSIVKS